MSLKELFEIAEKAGNEPMGTIPDRREALAYMDVASREYREQAAKLNRRDDFQGW